LALWNGKDPILKERLFGLTNSEGNHGEDVKEYYFYLDSTPTHSYMKYLYKYPQAAYPYADLVETNRRRSKNDLEYELLDTGVFKDDRYFDVFVEYAKDGPEDINASVSTLWLSPRICFLSAPVVFPPVVLLPPVFVFTSAFFGAAFFFGNFFLGVTLFLAAFFIGATFLPAVLFDFVCSFLVFLLVAIRAVYHRLVIPSV
jgi:hypothetical protein